MATESIHPDTTLGYVHLTVRDLNRSVEFYQQRLGFQIHRQEANSACLGAGRADLLRLTEHRQARSEAGTTGLYHFAILVPSRRDLAQVLGRIAQTRTLVQGFADHGVSEAIYLPDPDGNGIEVYRDRPREQWPFEDGQLQMVVDSLDTEGLLAELAGQPDAQETWPGLPPDTVLGHMHLHVSNLKEAERFYRDVVGFELMQRFGETASFLSAGGYHHHLGINTWAGVGAPQPSADAAGLREFIIDLPNGAALSRVVGRIEQAGVGYREQGDGIHLRDPSGNGIVLRSATQPGS